MRTRMDLLLSKYMMLRSEDRRHAELADIFAIEASKEGIHGDVKMLCLKLHSGKVFVIAIVFDFFFIYMSIFHTNCRQIRMEKHSTVLHFVIPI
jgi:hypothetical protein